MLELSENAKDHLSGQLDQRIKTFGVNVRDSVAEGTNREALTSNIKGSMASVKNVALAQVLALQA